MLNMVKEITKKKHLKTPIKTWKTTHTKNKNTLMLKTWKDNWWQKISYGD